MARTKITRIITNIKKCKKINILQIFLVSTAFLLILSIIPTALGHGLGLDTISTIKIGEREISVTIETPINFMESLDKQISITALDKKTKENVNNITFLIGLFHENKLIFKDQFFAPAGYLIINVEPTSEGEIKVSGKKDSSLNAYYTTESQPIRLTGPVFQTGGLYHFELETKTIESPDTIIESSEVYVADVSIIDETHYLEKDISGEDVKFRIKSYFDKISKFQYDAKNKTVTFEMPFDWDEKTMSHVPVVHEEVHFPKDFAEFLSPSYVGKVNEIELFKSSVTVDDYTEEDERIVHFVLLNDHLQFLKKQQKKSSDILSQNMVFTLTTSDKVQFPMVALTKNEEIQVDLSWDPIKIEPDKPTKFVFTFRNAKTGETLRQSSYDFVIIQRGNEIFRISGMATVGGGFEEYTFDDSQTGPTLIKFENIRGLGLETEFGLVVVPEFASFVLVVMILALVLTILLSRINFIKNLKSY